MEGRASDFDFYIDAAQPEWEAGNAPLTYPSIRLSKASASRSATAANLIVDSSG